MPLTLCVCVCGIICNGNCVSHSFCRRLSQVSRRLSMVARQLLLLFHHLVCSMRLPVSPSPPLPPLPLSPSPLLTGELDDIPEVAFDMVGTIQEVVRNAEQLGCPAAAVEEDSLPLTHTQRVTLWTVYLFSAPPHTHTPGLWVVVFVCMFTGIILV